MPKKSDENIVKGIVVPMVTPFSGQDGNSIDVEALKDLSNYLIDNGVNGLMPLGTSGEFALQTREERRIVIETVVKTTKGRIPVIAGVSSPGTRDTIELATDAQKAGADVVISTGPYYYKTSSEGLLKHFQMLIDNSSLPIMIYNIPGWIGYNIPAFVVRKLLDSNPGKVLGVKFTTNDLGEFLEYLRLLKDDMSIMIGADALVFPALEMGARGAVIGSANVLPYETSEIYDNYLTSKFEKAKKFQNKVDPFCQAMVLGTYPAGLKAALKMIGLNCGPVRAPLVDLNSEETKKVRASIKWILKNKK